ncbi:MAG: DUF433 domain-containing protein [Gemmataceae bacterium]|nr:DUF433 domain-containing protein [Gemmataceae bacterium]MCI0743604.1 DUF433 domain-containing protein [Gemmataceae bacterium]
MSTNSEYPHIEKPEGKGARLKRLPRIRVSMIVSSYLAHGYSVDEMCRQFPHLQPAETHSAMAYYFEHQNEIDQELADELKAAQEGRKQQFASPVYQKLKAKGFV